MTTSEIQQFLHGLWTFELLPFLLAFTTACLTLYFDRREADTPAKRRKAVIMFVVGGIVGTCLSILLFGQKQMEAVAATNEAREERLRAKKMSSKLDEATHQLGELGKQLVHSDTKNRKLQEQILESQEEMAKTLTQISNWLGQIQAQTNLSVVVISNTLQIFEQVTVNLTRSADTEINQRAKETLNAIIQVRNALSDIPQRARPVAPVLQPLPSVSVTNQPPDRPSPPLNLHIVPGF